MNEHSTFIDLGLDDAKELKSVPAGEYNLRVIDAKIGTSKNTGGNYLQATLEVLGEVGSKNVSHVMMFPAQNDDPKKVNNRKLAIRNFVQACGLDTSKGFDAADLVGATCWAILVEEDDPEYGTQNRIRKMVTGK